MSKEKNEFDLLLHKIIDINLDEAKILIKNGADINATDNFGNNILLFAMKYRYPGQNDHITVTEFLLDNGIDINKTEALHMFASNKEYIEFIPKLIVLGADVNARDSEGKTPLHHAVIDNITSAVFELIKAGADMSLSDKSMKTPMQYSIEKKLNHITIMFRDAKILKEIEKYIGEGKDIKKTDRFGTTLLHHAAILSFDGCKKLIEAGADVNAQDENGDTPLHYAAKHDNEENVAILIKFGSRIDIKNKQGNIPQDLGAEKAIEYFRGLKNLENL
ncbi:MAG: hypothetical protein EOP34_07490, partial [Rickettsiales bacterium]